MTIVPAINAESALEAIRYTPFDDSAAEAEGAVLGAMILDAEQIPAVREILAPAGPPEKHPGSAAFGIKRHQVIYAGICHLNDRGAAVDFTTLIDLFRTSKRLADVGGQEGVIGLEKHVFATSNAVHHARCVLRRWRLSELARLGENLIKYADGRHEPDDLIDAAGKRMQRIQEAGVMGEGVDRNRFFSPTPEAVEKILSDLIGESAGAEMEPEKRRAVPWLWPQLNAALGPLPRGAVCGILAPPGVGKTAFVMQQILHSARSLRLCSLAVLMESDEQQQVIRLAQQHYGVDGRLIRTRRITAEVIDGFMAAKAGMSEFCDRLHFSFPGPVNADRLDALVKAWRRKHGGRKLDVLAIDHLHKMPPVHPKHSLVDRMEHAMHRIGEIAAREQCAVYLILQPAKDEYKPGENLKRRPSLSGIKGGGSVGEGIKQCVALWYPSRSKEPIIRGHLCVIKANDGQADVDVPSMYIGPSTLHIESASQSDYSELVRRYQQPEETSGPAGRVEYARSNVHDVFPF